MKTLKLYALSAGGVAILAITAAVMESPRAAAVDGGPTVTIASPLPLPVTGSTTVSGTVAATQSGAWNVGITGNTEANPFFTSAADNPARSPFTLTGSFAGGGIAFLGQVPPGQRYVIEHYAVGCSVDPGGTLTDIFVGLNKPEGVDDHAVPHLTFGDQFVSIWAGSATTRLYVDPGQHIDIGASVMTGNLQSCKGSVSGYSVSLQ